MIQETKTAGLPALPTIPSPAITTFSKRVMVAMPWQKQVHPITAFCVAQLLDKRRTSSMICFGDAFVAHSRNHCVDEFLKTDSEYILMVDDDMLIPFGNSKWFKTYTGWQWYPEPFASFNAIDRLMSHKKSVVGALYFGRHPEGPPVFALGASIPTAAEYARKGPHNEIIHTGWVGTGCILIHRKVFEDIERKFPLLARGPDGKGGNWFTSSEHEIMDGVKQVHTMLSSGAMDGLKAMKAYEMLDGLLAKTKNTSCLSVGEDVILSRRATQCGHEVFVDLGLICGHVGHACYGPRNTMPKKLA
jgi:hypothetical protein